MAAHTIEPDRLRPATAEGGGQLAAKLLFGRFAFSAAWVALAFSVAKNSTALSAVLLVSYPLWEDALAYLVDATAQRRPGPENKSQIAQLPGELWSPPHPSARRLGRGMNTVLVVFGVWASLSGCCSLRRRPVRWKTFGAQWCVILSGAQSRSGGSLHDQARIGSGSRGHRQHRPVRAFGAFFFTSSSPLRR